MDDLPDFDLPDLPDLSLASLASLGSGTEPADPTQGPEYPLTLDDTGPGLGLPAPPAGGLTETQDSGPDPSYTLTQHQAGAEAPGWLPEALGGKEASTPLPPMPDSSAGLPGASEGFRDSLASLGPEEGAFESSAAYSQEGGMGEKLDAISESIQALTRHLTSPSRPTTPPAPRQDVGGSTYDR